MPHALTIPALTTDALTTRALTTRALTTRALTTRASALPCGFRASARSSGMKRGEC